MPDALRKTENKPRDNGTTPKRKRTFSSRVTCGSQILPSIDGRSTWSRIMRDVMLAMTSHAGGHEHISEARRLLVRRVAALEAELIHMEDRFAQMRAEGGTPPSKGLDLYQRMVGSQRRVLESLGLNPTMRDVTPPPDPLAYAASYRREAEEAEVAA